MEVRRDAGIRFQSITFQDLRTVLSYISDVYLGKNHLKHYVFYVNYLRIAFVFWSIYTSLLPSLFYFSVWKLGIAGAELALLTILSPGVLGISVFKSWAASRSGRTILHALSLIGLLAYKFTAPFERLLCVAFANVIVCIGCVVDWSGLSGQSPEYSALCACKRSKNQFFYLLAS